MSKRKIFLGLILLITVSAFFRLYRIADTSIFLADQGVTGIEIYNAYTQKTVPLVGPVSSYGFYHSPFYYHLVYLPFVLSGFNPTIVAVYQAFFGIATTYLIYLIGRKLFTMPVAFFVAFCYAFSPLLITSDKTIWNPTPIPFFTALLFVSWYQLYRSSSLWWWIVQGICLSVLIQLHYSCFFLLFVNAIFIGLILVLKKQSIKSILVGSIVSTISFFVLCSPFLYYQYTTNFVDLSNFILVFLSPASGTEGGKPFAHIYESFSKLYTLVFPFPLIVSWLGLFAVVTGWRRIKKEKIWPILLAIWLVMGLLLTSFSNSNIEYHYLYFLLLPTLLSMGYLLMAVNNTLFQRAVMLVGSLLLLTWIPSIDVFSTGLQNIPTARAFSDKIIEIAGNEPFAFGLLSSRSFADTHYRFFLKNARAEDPNTVAPLLLLVCETTPCPEENSLMNKEVELKCPKYSCGIYATKIDLQKWRYIRKIEEENGTIYIFENLNPEVNSEAN